MKNILAKFEAQAKKVAKAREREYNRPCLMCKKPIRENGFGSIPRICKKCEDEEVYN